MAMGTDDPANKVAIRVKSIGPGPTMSSDQKAVAVAGDVVYQDADVGEATLYIAGPASKILEVGKTYQLVAVGQ